jgi:hypothetical protein
MRNHTTEEEKILSRIRMLREMVAEASLHETPCPLQDSNLNDLSVLTERLTSQIRRLQLMLDHRKKGERE